MSRPRNRRDEYGEWHWNEYGHGETRWTRYYHTPSTIPKWVRPDVIRGWRAMWRKLRKYCSEDRRLEFKSGTRLKTEGGDFRVRFESGIFFVSLSGFLHGWDPNAQDREIAVKGSCPFGEGRPETYLDDLQEALDTLTVTSIMER